MEEDTIQVNKEIISELFNIAGIEIPQEISDEALLECVFKIKSAIQLSQQNQLNPIDFSQEENFETDNSETKNILVVDDIGIVTYQLKILLSNLGYNVHVSKDIFSALNSFVNNRYDFVVMDLFVSTEQEGYTLLNETRKIIAKNNLNTKIIVITASSKAENKVKCLNGGASSYVKKDTGWQDRLIDIIENRIDPSALE